MSVLKAVNVAFLLASLLYLDNIIKANAASHTGRALLCDPDSLYKPASPSDLSCPPMTSTRDRKVTVEIAMPRPKPVREGACICSAVKVQHECQSNILWSVTDWVNQEQITPDLKTCIQLCQDDLRKHTYTPLPPLVPLQCPWWSHARNTTVHHMTELATALYHPTTNKLDVAGDRRATCIVVDGRCQLNRHEWVIVDQRTIRADCQFSFRRAVALLRQDGQNSASITVQSEEITLEFSNICVETVCNQGGVFSDEGYFVASTVFGNNIPPCPSRVIHPGAQSQIAHSEFQGATLSKKLNKLHQNICWLSMSLLQLYLLNKMPIPDKLIALLNHDTLVHNSYVIRDGTLYSKQCQQVIVHMYHRLCPGVWQANTSHGVYYAHPLYQELSRNRPNCLSDENLIELPGNYLVVLKNGIPTAERKWGKHHLVIKDLSHISDTLFNQPLDFSGLINTSFLVESQSQTFQYESSWPGLGWFFRWHPLLSGFTGFLTTVMLIIVGWKITSKLISTRRSRTRRRRPSDIPADDPDILPLHPRVM